MPPATGLTSSTTGWVHLACDGKGRPLGFALSGGNVNDCSRLEAVLAAIRVPWVGSGRPWTQPDHVIADQGYNSCKIRAYLRGAVSRTRFPSASTRLSAVSTGAQPAAGRPASTGRFTGFATWSSDASTG
ncbi:transposase [Kitasatospora brasiliensis]|uniref:transposase n=1 Tax=Kitasatospora brasiliensis TaxID=3058040 RepID=UPI003D7733FA